MNTVQPLSEHDKLAGLFEHDHDRLIKLLGDVDVLGTRDSFRSAAKVFGEFRHYVEEHIHEEDHAIARLLRDGECSTRLAWRTVTEHAMLKDLIEQTWKAIGRTDALGVSEPVLNLARFLANHEVSERQALRSIFAAAKSRSAP